MKRAAEPWTCPKCVRVFGGAKRAHTCIPALTLDEYFGGRPPADRAIFDAVSAHLASLGPVLIEAVYAGIFFKRSSIFATLRPRRRGLGLGFTLHRTLASPRITRSQATGTRNFYTVPLQASAEVDDEVRAWLAEAYEAND